MSPPIYAVASDGVVTGVPVVQRVFALTAFAERK
jgi:hypothetical protein